MTISISSLGLEIEDFARILDSIVDAVAVALDLTPVQKARVRSSVQSVLGNLARIDAERELVMQEALVAVYNTLSLETTGENLSRLVKLLGLERRAAFSSQVTGTAGGTSSTVIPEGTRIQYNPESTVWLVQAGYVVGDTDIVVVAEETGGALVAVDPETGYDDWTILDTVVGFDTFESSAQGVTGAPIESDSELRNRASIEIYRRGLGPERAIEAAVLLAGPPYPTYARAYSNRTLTTDAEGIPGKAINVVVEGGTAQLVGEAIFASRPAGAEVYADATNRVDVTVVDQDGFGHSMPYNTVTDVRIWINVDLETSTSETTTTAGITDLVEALLATQAPLLFGIGDDVLSWKLEGEIADGGYEGITRASVTVSDDGAVFSANPYTISIRERPTFALADIVATES